MTPIFGQLHPLFFGEASAIDLRRAHDNATLDSIRSAMDRFAVVVFHDQSLAVAL